MTNTREKHLLTDKDILTMRREIFKKRGNKHIVIIPNSFMECLARSEETLNWRGQVLLGYIGVILTYREAYYTYRKHHMNFENIADFMGVNKDNKKVYNAFTKNSFLAKEKYITHVNDMPYSYDLSYVIENEDLNRFFNRYKMASDMSKEEMNNSFYNMKNRYKKCIEPTRHVKGITRKRGRGTQIIEYPYDYYAKDFISFSYDTISEIISGKLTPSEFYVLAVCKHLTRNGWSCTGKNSFRTSYKSLSNKINVSSLTVGKALRKIQKLYPKQFDYKIIREFKDNQFYSRTYLTIDCKL